MAPTKLIAGLMGPLFLAMGVALLLNRDLFPAIAGQLSQNYAVVFIAGAIALVAGVAIVRVHNIWSGGWPVIVTVLGWLAIGGGLARMWVPQLAGPITEAIAGNPATLLSAGIVVLALGAFLTLKSYGSS
jgi:hypothetical protein